MLKLMILVMISLLIVSCSKDKKETQKVIKKEVSKAIKKKEKKQPKDLVKLYKYFLLGSKVQEKKAVHYKEANLIVNKIKKSIKPFFIKKDMPFKSESTVSLMGDIVTYLMKDDKKIYQVSLKYQDTIDEKIKSRYKEKYENYPIRRFSDRFTKLLVGNFEVIVVSLVTPKDKKIQKESMDKVLASIDYKAIEGYEKDPKNGSDIEIIKKLKNNAKKLVEISSELTNERKFAIIALEPFIKNLKEKHKDYKFTISYSGNYTISMQKEKKQQAWIVLNYNPKSFKHLEKKYTDEFVGLKAKRLKDISLRVILNNLSIAVTAKKGGEFATDAKLDELFNSLDIERLKLIK